MLLFISILFFSSITVFAQNCKQLHIDKESIVCECNSTYCDYYPDPPLPEKGEFIWYVTNKDGLRLQRSDGKISDKPKYEHIIKINSKKTYQVMKGFGGAFTDSAGINIKSLSRGAQSNLMMSYFSSKGINYNLGRVPIGGSDFSTRPYTYDDVPGDTKLKNFTLTYEDFNYKIPLMKTALNLNPQLRFVSASWTAPSWMKNNSNIKLGHLKKEYYQIYANYILKFLEEYKKYGMKIWSISIGNEPLTPLLSFSTINSMYWSPRMEAKWIMNNLVPTLKKSKFNNTQILIYEDQRFLLHWYMAYIERFYKDALQHVNGIGLHGYADVFVPVKVLEETHKLIPNKYILLTEYSTGSLPWESPKVSLGSWSRAEQLITAMFENINHWVAGWVDWNLAVDTQGGPSWVGNNVDALIIVDAKKDVFYKQPMFYAMAHFSKFVPRSSLRIETNNNETSILVTAFSTSDNKIVILLYNSNGHKKNVTLADEKIGYINIELPKYSLHTLQYQNEQYLKP